MPTRFNSPVRVKFICPQGQWFRAQSEWEKILAHASTVSVRQTGINARDAARANVAASGLGPDWQRSFVSSMHPKRGEVLNPWAWVHSRINFAEVFETGKTIVPSKAKYLWIPTPSVPQYPGTGTAKAPWRRMNPKKYQETIGPLKFIHPPGKAPMLLGQISGSIGATGAARKGQLPTMQQGFFRKRSKFSAKQQKKIIQWVPMFIGVGSVTLEGRMSVHDAMVKEIKQLPMLYKKALAEAQVK